MNTHYNTEAMGLDCVTVDNTSGGKTLAQLGIVFDLNVRSISLQALDGTVYVSKTSADATSFQLPALGAVELRILSITAAKLKFYAAGNTKMNVLQLGE